MIIDNFSLKDISSESREVSVSLDIYGREEKEVNQGKLNFFYSKIDELALFCICFISSFSCF